VVLSGADITKFASRGYKCLLSVDEYERRVFVGQWISDEAGVFLVAYASSELKPFALVAVYGLPLEEALAVLGSVRESPSER
jgi:hypothetical protein